MCKASRKKKAAWKREENKRKKLRVVVWHGKQEMPVARARVSTTED
jgi:hypothetical protein